MSENGVPSNPPGYDFSVEYIGHADTMPMLQGRYEGLQVRDLIGGEAFALESVRLSTHNGTHVDAPWHCRVRRLALYDEVQRRRAAGEPLTSIARTMNLARGTVRNYAYASSFPERGARRPGRSTIDRHLPHLQARVAEGCEDAAVLWRELQARGFTGTARQVRRWMSEQRRRPAKTAPHRWRGRAPANPGSADGSPPAPLPAARPLAWLLVQPPAALPAADAAAVGRVEQDKDALVVAKLAPRFTALVRGCNAGSQTDAVAVGAELDAWLVEAGECGVPALETFAAGLCRKTAQRYARH